MPYDSSKDVFSGVQLDAALFWSPEIGRFTFYNLHKEMPRASNKFAHILVPTMVRLADDANGVQVQHKCGTRVGGA